jgi:hypothetical protein
MVTGTPRPNFIFVLTDDQGWAESAVPLHPGVRHASSLYEGGIHVPFIAVGLLGLSSISLRSSGQGQAQAQANARMALQVAIGDLQKALGPDQRISARASLVNGDKGEANLIGVWESWRWDPLGGSAPDYAGKRQNFISQIQHVSRR